MLIGQSWSLRHSTQTEPLHSGVGALQFASVEHATHRPSAPQTGVDVPLQSAAVTHWTHDDVAASQCCAVAGHWLSAVQPERQVNSCGSQIGAATPQSAFETQRTHWFLRQRGASVGQSVFARHSTHCCDVGSHVFASRCVQSALVWQPMQAPLVVSQIGAWSRPHMALLVHAAWHVWSPGQQTGVAVPLQSALVRHCPHEPATQTFALAGHCVSAVHSTQPSVASHCSAMPQWFVPFTPHTALPAPGPPSPPEGDAPPSASSEWDPPQAATTPMATNATHKLLRLTG
jgi:hypothetical protein